MFMDITGTGITGTDYEYGMCRSYTMIYMVITGIAVKLDSRSALSPLASCYS